MSTKRLVPLALLALCASPFAGAAGTGTPAGTTISNTATATFTSGGNAGTASSNTNTFTVAELVQATMAWSDAGSVLVTSPDSNRVLTFTLTNTGNGPETFGITGASAGIPGDDFDPAADSIYLDANGNGSYDAGIDTLYSNLTQPTLNPQQSLVLFFLNDIPAGRAPADRGFSRLTATALTGTGAGTVVPGAGVGGTDAVIGSGGGIAADTGTYAVDSDYTLVKSYAVNDGSGGSVPKSGATVTYTLLLTASGTGTSQAATIADAIPAGTTYVAGSIALDGTPLPDAAAYTGSAVSIAIPAEPFPPSQTLTHTVTFRVTVN